MKGQNSRTGGLLNKKNQEKGSLRNNRIWLAAAPATVAENIIGAPKMQKKFWYIFFTHICSYCSSNFAIEKVVAINLFASFSVPVFYINSWLLFLLFPI